MSIAKPEWNSNLSDLSRYALTEDQLEKRKKMLESNHSIYSSNYKPTSSKKLTSETKKSLKKIKSVLKDENNKKNKLIDNNTLFTPSPSVKNNKKNVKKETKSSNNTKTSTPKITSSSSSKIVLSNFIRNNSQFKLLIGRIIRGKKKLLDVEKISGMKIEMDKIELLLQDLMSEIILDELDIEKIMKLNFEVISFLLNQYSQTCINEWSSKKKTLTPPYTYASTVYNNDNTECDSEAPTPIKNPFISPPPNKLEEVEEEYEMEQYETPIINQFSDSMKTVFNNESVDLAQDPENLRDFEIMRTLTSLSTRSLATKLPITSSPPASNHISTVSSSLSYSSPIPSTLATPETIEKKSIKEYDPTIKNINFNMSNGFTGTSPTDYLFLSRPPQSIDNDDNEEEEEEEEEEGFSSQYSPSLLYNSSISTPLANEEFIQPRSSLKTSADNNKPSIKKEVHFSLPSPSSSISSTPPPPPPSSSFNSYDDDYGLADSYDAMIDRLSYHLSETLSTDETYSPSRNNNSSLAKNTSSSVSSSINSDSSTSSTSPTPSTSISSIQPSTPSLHPFHDGIKVKENIPVNFNKDSALLAALIEKSKSKNILENPFN